jgi:hypothetical protein
MNTPHIQLSMLDGNSNKSISTQVKVPPSKLPPFPFSTSGLQVGIVLCRTLLVRHFNNLNARS